MQTTRQIFSSWVGVFALLTLTGCTESDAPLSPPEASATQVVTRLPVSLNRVMVAMVNQAADPIWVAAWRNPSTDEDWRELERRAVQLELGGTLLSVPGTGPMDNTWTDSPGWQNWSAQLRDVGASAFAAIKARNFEEISTVGDELVAICEGCHIEFKPTLPTGGEFGELSPTEEDFEN